MYGNLANVRKGGDTEVPPPIPGYKPVDKPPARSVVCYNCPLPLPHKLSVIQCSVTTVPSPSPVNYLLFSVLLLL